MTERRCTVCGEPYVPGTDYGCEGTLTDGTPCKADLVDQDPGSVQREGFQ